MAVPPRAFAEPPNSISDSKCRCMTLKRFMFGLRNAYCVKKRIGAYIPVAEKSDFDGKNRN
jgi:hypothetical protein